MSQANVDIHYSPIGSAADYWCLLSDYIVSTTVVETTIQREGHEPERKEIEIGTPLRRGLYAFRSKEKRDKFVRSCNSLSDLETEIAFPVSHSTAQNSPVRYQR